MILVYDEILERIEKFEKYKDVYAENDCRPLIENFKIENIQSASYDVSIGDTIMVESSITTVDLSRKEEIELVFEEKKIEESYTIKPNEYIIVALNETINMPDDLCGHIRPRTTFNKLGLIITSQHINPSFDGVLKIGIKNMTSHAFKFYPHTTIVGQIVFEKLSGKVREDKLYRNIKTAKYQSEGKEFIHSKVYDEQDKKIAEELFNGLLNRGIKNELKY